MKDAFRLPSISMPAREARSIHSYHRHPPVGHPSHPHSSATGCTVPLLQDIVIIIRVSKVGCPAYRSFISISSSHTHLTFGEENRKGIRPTQRPENVAHIILRRDPLCERGVPLSEHAGDDLAAGEVDVLEGGFEALEVVGVSIYFACGCTRKKRKGRESRGSVGGAVHRTARKLTRPRRGQGQGSELSFVLSLGMAQVACGQPP